MEATTAYERRRALADEVRAKGTVLVGDAARRFGVSRMTIRSDLGALSEQGVVLRIRGGAVAPAAASAPAGQRYVRTEPATPSETALVKAAASLIGDGDSIALDGSDVVCSVARQLAGRRDLTAVVGAIDTAQRLAAEPTNTVVLAGGLVAEDGVGLKMHPDERSLHGLRVNLALLCCGGCDADGVLYAKDPYTAEVKHALLTAARSVVLLIAHAIPDPKEVAPFGRLEAAHRILTVQPLSAEVMARVPADCQVTVVGLQGGASQQRNPTPHDHHHAGGSDHVAAVAP